MSKKSSILWVILIFLFFSNCSLWPKGESSKHPRAKGGKESDSLSLKKDSAVVTEGVYPMVKEDSTKLEKRKREKTEGEIIFPEKVYRVQFFATKYPEEAKQVATLVEGQLSQKTYIDYKVPYYWVRVGDCETKEEANSLLEKIKSLGYQESWVVEIKLKQP
jgi:hypothetical protein